MELPNNFYTVSTFFTLSGTSMAVLLITNILDELLNRKIKKLQKKWMAFILSMFFSLLGVTLIAEKSPLVWVVAFVNGFLIYSTSVGWNSVMGKAEDRDTSSIRKTSAGKDARSFSDRFFEKWW
jgi:hypothetical protein